MRRDSKVIEQGQNIISSSKIMGTLNGIVCIWTASIGQFEISILVMIPFCWLWWTHFRTVKVMRDYVQAVDSSSINGKDS